MTCLPKATSSRILSNILLLSRKRYGQLPHSQQVRRYHYRYLYVADSKGSMVGNIAIGNLHQFLPAILTLVQSDPKKRLLSLHALKEVGHNFLLSSSTQLTFFFAVQVVTNCSRGQLEGVADLLWVPLFENSDNSEETTRNVAAACLGKLTTTHPSRYLPQLHVRSSFANFVKSYYRIC